MSAESNIFRKAVPTEPRLRVDLPCHLRNDDTLLTARVCNINHSGMQIRLPPEPANAGFRDLRTVKIEGVGTFNVVAKWQRNGRIGLQFSDRNSARPLLDTFFRSIGRFP